MGSQDRVVGLNDGSGNLGSWVNGEFQLGFLAVVDRETFHQQGGESRASASAKGMENEKSLKTSALIGQLSDAVKHQIDDLLANGVVATSVVIGSIFLASDQLFGVEKRAVSTSADLINDSWLQVDKDGTRDMLARASLREKGVERIITTTHRLIRGHLTIRLDSMLQAVQFPASVTDLDSGLTNVD